MHSISMLSTAETIISAQQEHDTFHLLDLNIAKQLYLRWSNALPTIQPFFAIKCNPDPKLATCLAGLGAGFDCASQQEMQQVLALGVQPDRILYAHTCKPPSHLRFALEHNISWTTVDTVCELNKISRLYPTCKVLLRIRCDDPGASISLGVKYGAEAQEVLPILQAAKQLGVAIAGVAFHVGTNATGGAAYVRAIAEARKVFDQAISMGFSMQILDIGGGFSGGFTAQFEATASAINTALAELFPAECGVRVIAEPGRFFAEHVQTIAVAVNGYRDRAGKREYWLSDGVYGSFNNMMYEPVTLTPIPLRNPTQSRPNTPPLKCSQLPGNRQLPTWGSISSFTSTDTSVPLSSTFPPEIGHLRDSIAADDIEYSEITSTRSRSLEISGFGNIFDERSEQLFESVLWGPTCCSVDKLMDNVMLPLLDVGDFLLFSNMGAYSSALAGDFNGFAASKALKYYIG